MPLILSTVCTTHFLQIKCILFFQRFIFTLSHIDVLEGLSIIFSTSMEHLTKSSSLTKEFSIVSDNIIVFLTCIMKYKLFYKLIFFTWSAKQITL